MEFYWLIDATNALNTINRQAALHNVSVLCPPLATILRNTYQEPSTLVVPGNGEIIFYEGTAQGDPLSMAFYTLAITPLIQQLRENCGGIRQVWFADDTTGAGSFDNLREGGGMSYHPVVQILVIILMLPKPIW